MQSAKMWSTTGLSSWTFFVFNIYINDHPLNVEDGQMVLFADDFNLLIVEN
jgi:hypothetical protein